ncbi:MAG: DUF488 family protein [Nitrospiraceae bacterium]|nr:DUF488 family protein [Nitrospiraceae bacterium]
MVKTKRVYDAPAPDDGLRVLVDRVWPRGLTREKARVDIWIRDIAPSSGLRKWFSHDETKWEEFRKRYFSELDAMDGPVSELRNIVKKTKRVTFLFGSKEEKYNNANALIEYLKKKSWCGAP